MLWDVGGVAETLQPHRPQLNSIYVFPFLNISHDNSLEFFINAFLFVDKKIRVSVFWGFEVMTICWESAEIECLMSMLCPGLVLKRSPVTLRTVQSNWWAELPARKPPHRHSISCPSPRCEVYLDPCVFYPDDEVSIQTDEREWDALVFQTHTYILKRVR